jgi:ubiquinone/menaquinone biosynthesis C-methylase UbiE
MNTKWQLSGSAADLYESYLVPTIFVPWAKHLMSRASIRVGNSVLDIACGTGIVARMIKPDVGPKGRVVGVDLNASMLEVAARESGDAEIEWMEADVGSIPLPSETFDTAICQQGLQFFPDKRQALMELLRLLRSGGECLACVAGNLEDNPLMRSQVAALSKHVGPDAAAGIRAVCGLADADHIRGLFSDAGYVDVAVETVTLTLEHDDATAFVTNGIASTPVAGLIADWPNERLNALLSDILDGFGEYYDGKSLRFPHVSNVIVARKP